MNIGLLSILIRKPYEKIDLPFGKNYCCPICQTEPPEGNDGLYKRNGKQYPVQLNESKGFNGDCNYHDWDEIHYCNKCKIEYYYSNGAY